MRQVAGELEETRDPVDEDLADVGESPEAGSRPAAHAPADCAPGDRRSTAVHVADVADAVSVGAVDVVVERQELMSGEVLTFVEADGIEVRAENMKINCLALRVASKMVHQLMKQQTPDSTPTPVDDDSKREDVGHQGLWSQSAAHESPVLDVAPGVRLQL